MKKSYIYVFCTLCAPVLFLLHSMQAQANIGSFDTAKTYLMSKKSADKIQALDWVVQNLPTEQARPLLEIWLGGKLYYQKQTMDLYKIPSLRKDEPAYTLWENRHITITNKRAFKKISVNNQLRTAIKQTLATMDIFSSNPAVRYKALQSLVGKTDADTVQMVQKLLMTETDTRVKSIAALAVAVADAQHQDTAAQMQAIGVLKQSKNPIVPIVLKDIIVTTADTDIATRAEQALQSYESTRTFYNGVETVFFGLSLGSVLVLASIGLAITFGVMGVINMAHGELIMIGAYTVYVIQAVLPDFVEYTLLLSIPVAFVVSGFVGIVMERLVIRHLYGRPLETLLATFGVSLILQQAVRTIFSPLNRSVSTPDWMAGSWHINDMLSLTYNRLYIIIFCAVVFGMLWFIMHKSRLGLQVRAVSQNRTMAQAMGVRSHRVDMMSFGLGSGIAGIAGVALSQLTNVGPNMGQAYIVDSFMVVVFGGVGNLWGTLTAGLSLGILNKVLEPSTGAVLAKILVLICIIGFIQNRPKGLFPQKGRAAEE